MSLRRFQLLAPLPAAPPAEAWAARVLWPDGHCRLVTVTLLPAREGGFSAARERARRLGWARSPVIPALVDVVGLAGRAAAVVERLEGVDLATLHRRGALPRRAALELLGVVTGGLDAAWSRSPFAGEPPLREAHGALGAAVVAVDALGRVRVGGFAALRLDGEEVDPQADRVALASLARVLAGEDPRLAEPLGALEAGSLGLDELAVRLRALAWATEGPSLAGWAEVAVRPAAMSPVVSELLVEEPVEGIDLEPFLLDLPADLGPPPPLLFTRPSTGDDAPTDEFGGPRPRRRPPPSPAPGGSTFGPPAGAPPPGLPRPSPLRLGAGVGQAARPSPRSVVPLAVRTPPRRVRSAFAPGPLRVDPAPPSPIGRRPALGSPDAETTGVHRRADVDPPTSPTQPVVDRPAPTTDLRAVLAREAGEVSWSLVPVGFPTTIPDPAGAPSEGERSLEPDDPPRTSRSVPEAARAVRPLPVAAAPEAPEPTAFLELDDVSRSLSIELEEVSVSLALEDTSHSDPSAEGAEEAGGDEGTEELSLVTAGRLLDPPREPEPPEVHIDDPEEEEPVEPPTQGVPDGADGEPTVQMSAVPSFTGLLAARLAAAVDEVSVPRPASEAVEPTLDIDRPAGGEPTDNPAGALPPAMPLPPPPAPEGPRRSLAEEPTAEYPVQQEPPPPEPPSSGRTTRPVEVRTRQVAAPQPAPVPVTPLPALDGTVPPTPPRLQAHPVPRPPAVPGWVRFAAVAVLLFFVLGGALVAWRWALAPLFRPAATGSP